MSSDAKDVIDQTLAGKGVEAIDPEKRYAVVTAANGVELIEPVADSLLLAPRRKKGVSTVYDTDGLAYLWNKYAGEQSELFADPKGFVLTAVLNADAPTGLEAGHRDHLIRQVCELTPAWQAWIGRDGRLMEQVEFAEFIEDRALEVVDPTAAEMLDLAQHFEASTKVEFKSVEIVSSGKRALQYEETVAAKAGQTGNIEIPTTFQIAVQPFVGGPAYGATCRFRYRIGNGHLSIGYKIERPELVLETAFDDVKVAASEACDRPVLLGSPASPRG